MRLPGGAAGCLPPTFSDFAKAVGVDADGALRKTDFAVYRKVLDAAFNTDTITGVSIEGTWRPSVADYKAVMKAKDDPYSKTSNHISNLAVDIVAIDYTDDGKNKSFRVKNGGYNTDENAKQKYTPKNTEPQIFTDFRRNLNDLGGLNERYDPWKMQKGDKAATNNRPLQLEKSDLDFLHNNHFHISIKK